jgi:hypothetical protein
MACDRMHRFLVADQAGYVELDTFPDPVRKMVFFLRFVPV